MRTLLAAAIVLTATQAVADTATCYNISDPNARTYCLARERKDPSACYAISSPDLRSMCLAEVRR